MADIAGYEKLPGRNPGNARIALDKSKANGFTEEDVRTVRDGYLIPLSELPEPAPAEDDTPQSVVPDDSWKNEKIEQYAQDNSIDLGGATKKADMLAAIAAAGESKE